MKAKSINQKNMNIRLAESLNHGQIINLYKEYAKTIRDLLLVAASLLFISCTMYYAIASRKNVSAQSTEYKVQNQKGQKLSL